MACLSSGFGLATLSIEQPTCVLFAGVDPLVLGLLGAGGGNGVLQLMLLLLGGYALVGVCVAVWFVGWGASRRDPAARRAPLRVRVLFGPGAVAVWPVLLTGRKQDGGPSRKGAA